jgi:hypothetical protein
MKMSLQINRAPYDLAMSQDPEVVRRYTDAQRSFEALFAGGGQPVTLESRQIHSFISLPLNQQQREVIIEVLQARRAYCSDLRASGFSSPVGFCDQTKSIEVFLD